MAKTTTRGGTRSLAVEQRFLPAGILCCTGVWRAKVPARHSGFCMMRIPAKVAGRRTALRLVVPTPMGFSEPA